MKRVSYRHGDGSWSFYSSSMSSVSPEMAKEVTYGRSYDSVVGWGRRNPMWKRKYPLNRAPNPFLFPLFVYYLAFCFLNKNFIFVMMMDKRDAKLKIWFYSFKWKLHCQIRLFSNCPRQKMELPWWAWLANKRFNFWTQIR